MFEDFDTNKFCNLTRKEKELRRERDARSYDLMCSSFLEYFNHPVPLDREEINIGSKG